MSRKPRTNDETIHYWAESALAREPADYIQVNSIIVDRDAVYSFGRHYPMGVIQRDERGRAKRIVLNSDFYPAKGFANTPGDQSTVRMEANWAVAQASWNIELKSQLLSSYATGGLIRVLPRDNDPEPPSDSRMRVSRRFTASDPGPEPVKPSEGCVAGEVEGYSKFERKIAWTNDMEHWDAEVPCYFDSDSYGKYLGDPALSRERHVLAWIDAVLDGRREMVWVWTWVTRWTVYGNERWCYKSQKVDGAHATYAQCPHCAEFEQLHERWHARMYGPRWGRGSWQSGWDGYLSNLEQFGGWEGWLGAWREDRDRVRRERDEYAKWHARNHIPLGGIPVVDGVPRTDGDGYALRIDERRYRAAVYHERVRRNRERRERERQAARQRQIERYKASILRNRRLPLAERAGKVADALRAMNATVPANDSLEEA